MNLKNNHDFRFLPIPKLYVTNTWKLIGLRKESTFCSALINRSIRRLNGASSTELFRYTIVTQVYAVSYGGWILKEEEFEETNFVKILQLT